MTLVASPATVVPLARRRAVAPTPLSVQDTPLGRVGCGMSWTLNVRRRPTRNATPRALARSLSVQDTPLGRHECGMSWTLNIAPARRCSGSAA